MIELNRGVKPAELTTLLQDELTEVFKKTGVSVWNLGFLKKALLAISSNKCCYCEADISEESKYLEVEHFHHKDEYPDEVMEWNNLLPSCKKCNGTKGAHDTKKEPIINPASTNPKNHLAYWRYRIKGVDELGKVTVSVLNLNDQDRLVKKRFEIGNAVQDKLEEINDLLDDYIAGIQISTRRKNRIVNSLKGLLMQGLPTKIYAATTAIIILTDVEYLNVKSKLLSLNLWDGELMSLEGEVSKASLNMFKA